MKKILLLLLLLAPISAVANSRFWVSGGTGNWSSTTNWSTTSGGSSGASVPANTDTVFLNSSGNVDITADAGTLNCYRFNVASGYTHKLTCTVDINVFAGGIQLVSGITFTSSTTKGFRLNGASTLTSGGVSVPVLVTFLTAGTYTLADNWTTTGGVTISIATVLNADTLFVNGGSLTMNQSLSGTAQLNFGPTGNMTWTGTSSLSLNTTINTVGTLTLGATLAYITGTLSYVAGTVTTTGSVLNAGTCTLNTNGMTWSTVKGGGTETLTLSSTLSVTTFVYTTGTLTFAGSAGWTVGTFTDNTPTTAATIVLPSGNTYIITTGFVLTAEPTVPATFKSSTSSSSAFLNYTGPPSGLNVIYTNFTDIDASGGNTIWAYVTTLTRTANINNRVAGSYVPITSASWSGQ